MKRFTIIMAIALLGTPAAFAREQSLLARVTVYWAKGGSGSDRDTRNHRCATGMRLQTGHCAVDPRKIPYGSRVVFSDGTALAAVDTGTAVKNRKAARKSGRTVYERNALVIDRFFETKRQALSWASRNPPFMTVRVVPPNQRALAQLPEQPPARAIMVVKSAPRINKAPAVSNQLVASTSSISRNPLNKLGR
jgi:3D (Asp-Asp-Asp) domain-containing protein